MWVCVYIYGILSLYFVIFLITMFCLYHYIYSILSLRFVTPNTIQGLISTDQAK